MKKIVLLITLCAIFSGCASTVVGDKSWHKKRMKEIESAYKDRKISESEYLSLKNEADMMHMEQQK